MSSPSPSSSPDYRTMQMLMAPLYNSVKTQNEMINVESSNMRDSFSTDKQRVKHMHTNIMGWNLLNYYLWIIYYIVVVVIYYLFLKGNIELEKNTKIYISIGLLLYPFLISTIELLIYNFFSFLYSVMIGIPYPKHSDQQPPISVFNGLPSLYY